MARRLLFLALGAAAAGAVVASRRRWSIRDFRGDGAGRGREEDVRRRIDEARERLRSDAGRAREQRE